MMTRLVKLATGEIVMGLNNVEPAGMKDVVSILINEENGELAISVAPINLPINDDNAEFIGEDNIIYDIKQIPQELEVAYANFKLAKNKQLIFSIMLACLLQAADNTLSVEAISSVLSIHDDLTTSFLNELAINGLITFENKIATLTEAGVEQAKQVTY